MTGSTFKIGWEHESTSEGGKSCVTVAGKDGRSAVTGQTCVAYPQDLGVVLWEYSHDLILIASIDKVHL